jgi:hypothetical protein
MQNLSKNWKEFLLKKEEIKANMQKELHETHLVSLRDQETILNNNIDNYFKVTEEKGRSRQRGIYRFYCMLSYKIDTGDRQRGLDDILADIRALPNVTIVSVVVSNERIAPLSYVAGLSIKFIPSTPGTFNDPEDVKKKIILGIKSTGNVQRVFRVSFKLERLE